MKGNRALRGWLASAKPAVSLAVAGLVAAVMSAPGVAGAQESSSRGKAGHAFVEASVLGSTDRALMFEGQGDEFARDQSWTMGAGVSVGWFLTKALTVTAELEVPHRAGWDFESHGYLYGASATEPGMKYRTATSRRNVTMVGLVGYQRSAGRVRPSVLVGGGFSRALIRQRFDWPDATGTWSSISERRFVRHLVPITFGADIEIAITSTFALVPRLRASIVMAGADTSASIFRPGLAARWTF